ncbi:MAG TPA: hypothetical protein VIV12_04275 [Streptosporangiaceae bacterium]
MDLCGFDANSPLVMQPNRLDAIKKRLDAYRADPGEPIDAQKAGLNLTSAQTSLLANSAGDVTWLIWAVEHLLEERRQLFAERDAYRSSVERARQALTSPRSSELRVPPEQQAHARQRRRGRYQRRPKASREPEPHRQQRHRPSHARCRHHAARRGHGAITETADFHGRPRPQRSPIRLWPPERKRQQTSGN